MRVLGETKLPNQGIESAAHMTSVTSEVINGDAFDLIHKYANQSVDLLITSPPYWGLRTYDLDHNWQIDSEWRSISDKESIPSYQWYRQHGGLLGLEPYPDWYIAHLVEFFELARPVLKETGSLWI